MVIKENCKSKVKDFGDEKKLAAPEFALRQLKSLIMSGKNMPGDKLPTERELAKMVGVSRPALREALKTLEALAIIEIVHGSGIYVREPDLDFATFPLTVMLNKNENIINELIEAREIVEVQIAVLAVQKIQDKDLQLIRDFLYKMNSEEYIASLTGVFDFQFEQLLSKLVGNRILASIQKATHEIWQIGLQAIDFDPLPVDIINEEHRMIFKAIKSRDEDAAKRAVAYHLRAPLRKIEGLI